MRRQGEGHHRALAVWRSSVLTERFCMGGRRCRSQRAAGGKAERSEEDPLDSEQQAKVPDFARSVDFKPVSFSRRRAAAGGDHRIDRAVHERRNAPAPGAQFVFISSCCGIYHQHRSSCPPSKGRRTGTRRKPRWQRPTLAHGRSRFDAVRPPLNPGTSTPATARPARNAVRKQGRWAPSNRRGAERIITAEISSWRSCMAMLYQAMRPNQPPMGL